MKKVMIVDDDEITRNLCESTLLSVGYHTIALASAEEALKRLHSETVDLLIADIVMPRMSGFELIKKAKEIPDFRAAIVMLTGKRENPDVLRAIDLGASDYICKPFDRALFLSKIILAIDPRNDKLSSTSFARTSSKSEARVVLTGQILSVNELGFDLRSKVPIEPDVKITVVSPLFQEMGIQPTFFRVVDCNPVDTSDELLFDVSVLFVGLDEYALRQIRKWVIVHSPQRALEKT